MTTFVMINLALCPAATGFVRLIAGPSPHPVRVSLQYIIVAVTETDLLPYG